MPHVSGLRNTVYVLYLEIIVTNTANWAQVNWKKRLTDGRMKNIAFVLDPDGYWIEVSFTVCHALTPLTCLTGCAKRAH